MAEDVSAVLNKIRGNSRRWLRRLGADLAKNSAQTLAIRVLGIALTYAFSLLVTNGFGPKAFGDYTFLVLTINVLSIFSALGLDALIVRFAAGKAAQSDWAALRGFDRRARWVQALAAVLVAGSLATAAALGWLSAWGSVFLFGVAALGILPQTWLKYFPQAFKGLRQIRRYAVFSYVVAPALALVFLGVFWYGQGQRAPALAHLAALTAAAGAAFFFWKKTLRKLPAADAAPLPETASLLRQSWPFLLTSSLMFLNHWVDQLLLKALRDSYELGLYAAGSRIVNVVTIPLLAVNSIVAPRLAGLWTQGDRQGLGRAARQATRLIVWSSLPVFAMVFVFAEFLLGLFGPEFVSGASAMRILLLGQCFNVLVGPTGAVLNMTRYERLMNRLALAGLIVNIAANLLLVPHFGAAGAAAGSAAGLIVLNGGAWFFIRKNLGFSTISI